MKKCEFHVFQISVLAYIIAQGQVKMDPAKVKAVLQWPTSANHKQLQRTLGSANFYRRFIHHLATLLTALISTFRQFLQTVFLDLKDCFTSAPILIQPEPTRQFVVEVDTLDIGVGAVLSQRSSEDGKLPILSHY